MKNTLIVVGVGIKFLSHLTIETDAAIKKATRVLYLVNDPAMKLWIQEHNPNSKSLDFLYAVEQPREKNYIKISEYVLDVLKTTNVVCLVMYGHPTFLAEPSLYSINLALKNGFNAYALPAISSEDCLFADLKIDPSSCGCQSFEATDFIIYEKAYDEACHLILFQVGMIGIQNNFKNQSPKKGLEILTECLLEKYDENHKVILYEAAQYPMINPRIHETTLMNLSEFSVTPLTTLYIPPSKSKVINEKYLNKIKSIV